MEIYQITEEQLEATNKLSATLCNGTDPMAKIGSQLWKLTSKVETQKIKHTNEPKLSWAEFNRFHSYEDFYGCVDKDGFWFDSARCFYAAVSFCGMHYQEPDADMRCMSKEGKKLGCSVIHSTLLKKMYEAGVIK